MSTRRNFLKLIAAIPVIGPLLVAPPVVDEWPKGESEEYDFWSPTIIEVNDGAYWNYSSAARDVAVTEPLKKHIKRIEK
jgi:hypothetical protein